MDFYPLPEEHALPPEEYVSPAEDCPLPDNEFAGFSRPSKAEEKPRHSLIKKLMLMPLAATVAAVSAVYASFGYDPLGDDFLTKDPYAETSGQEQTDVPEVPPVTGEDGVDQDDITSTFIVVEYLPTGEQYTVEGDGDDAMDDAVRWVESKGGSGATMKFVRSELIRSGVEFSDDAIVIGDMDKLDSIYLAQGTMTVKYVRYVYYEAEEDAGQQGDDGGDDEDPFPTLGNLDPDFDGAYAWSGEGSEEYVRFVPKGSGEYTYLEAGGVWKNYGASVSTASGARYDRETNTLTLENFTASVLDMNLMGNGFTINLIGDNSLDELTLWGAYYGGSVRITGTGTLVINKDGSSPEGIGINMNAEFSETCLMIDRGVRVEVYGSPAIMISSTTVKDAIFYPSSVTLTGGDVASGQFTNYSYTQYDDNGNYLGQVPITLDEIYEADGVRYYDCTVAGDDGNPSSHVTFAGSGS